MASVNNFLEIKEIVVKWWSALQYERKCNSTNTVYKIVSCLPEESQDLVRGLISQEIQKVIHNCQKSKDVNDMQTACNAINGCFDNFTHAVDAVRILFTDLISFIDFGLSECQSKLTLKNASKSSVLELLHSLSRILILVLKLKRTQGVKIGKNNLQNTDPYTSDLESSEELLSKLTFKIGQFLLTDDVLIDTKNNLSMSGILIREILISNESKIIEFQKKFVETIPCKIHKENFKLDVLKFLTCSAIINSWSSNIIDGDSTCTYLKFFISLCESYSSETPIILNTSRTLLLLIKHESFKEFVVNSDQEKIQQVISMLLSCVFMLLEHPVACVRHSAKDFLHILAATPSLQMIMIDSIFKLPVDKRSFFISIGALANEIGSRILIENDQELPKKLFIALCDSTIVSHVSLALEFIILKDSLVEKNFVEWCETWIVPLLISLINVMPIVAADIEKLLEKSFKKYPKAVIYITNKWAHPTSVEELRYVITVLKISHKQGFKLKIDSSNTNDDTEKKLIDEKLLEHCLHQRDDDIRISTFSLLIEAHKSTKPYSETDFRLIQYFLKYNLNNQLPATRQKVLGLVRKMLVRFSDSKAAFLKPAKNAEEFQTKSKNCLLYDNFLNFLVEFCFSNIFIGCNFNRLNTVLNILLLCFENIKDVSLNPEKTNFYWSKFLIALDSSYEENKDLAVVLSKKLDFSLLEANKPKTAKSLYEKAFSLCTHMEPPDVLTGSYLLQTLMNLPSSQEVLLKHFINVPGLDEVSYCGVQILTQKLKGQLQLAKLDLMTAATCGPMYGTLFAIRLILKNVDFSENHDTKYWECWSKTLNELVEISIEMTHIVGCVVNSSSPEGHLPMDFQTDFENLLSLKFSEECTTQGELKKSADQGTLGPKRSGSKIFPGNFNSFLDLTQNNYSKTYKTVNLLKAICDNFMFKFEQLETIIESSDAYDAYETLRSLKSLQKENQLLIKKVKDFSKNSKDKITFLDQLEAVRNKIEKNVEMLEKTNSVIDWPATAQVLLLCAWRSIKEASLYLGDLVTKLPIEKGIEARLLTKNTIIRIGEELKVLLCEIKHRGAFEHAYIGFTHLVNSLWKCSDKNLSNLPKQWLEEIINQLESPLEYQKMKFCSTRRSAGLPFLVQAIICSEIVSVKSTTPSSLHNTMKALLDITENGVANNSDSKIHALNILRALVKHAQLGEHVATYVSRALMVAIRGSRAATWSERNSSSLLFSSLIIRIFGVARSRDEISKKNRMTSRTFFQRYSNLYEFLLSEMDLVYSKENHDDGLYPKPSLYLVLLILGRLYPPPTEDPENIHLSEFLPYINMSRRNPTMKIRELGARALVPLIPLDRFVDELDDRFSKLSNTHGITQNERHGILLQIKALLTESVGVLHKLTKGTSATREISWIEDSKWMLQLNAGPVPYTIFSTYIKVLHLFYKNYPPLRNKISEVVLGVNLPDNPLPSAIPGIFLFFENFYFLKTDIVSCRWLSSSDYQSSENFLKLFMFMLNSKVSDIQALPLRILSFVLRDNDFDTDDDDDFSGIGVPVNDLLVFQTKKNVDDFRRKFISNPEILKLLVSRLNERNGEDFKSKVVHRLWLSTVSVLVMNDVVSISHSNDDRLDGLLKIDFAKSLLKSGDKDLSTNSLICYAIYLTDQISVEEKGKTGAEDRLVLADILKEFSCEDADVKERIAVARILHRCCTNLIQKNLIKDPVIMNIWMIPLALLLDEDPSVRIVAVDLVRKLQDYSLKEKPPEKLLVKMKTLDWPSLPLVSLKAQECLIDSYVNILGREGLLHLLLQLIIMAMSSFCELDRFDNYAKDEFGVFEKGNPNPFCEELALSNLVCDKLTELNSVVGLKAAMQTPLNPPLVEFATKSFHIPEFNPATLTNVVETVTALLENKLNKEFSMPQVQIRNLRASLGLREIP